MNNSEVKDLLRNTVFRPGWRFEGRDVPGEPSTVEVAFIIDTVDTSYYDRNGQYNRPRQFDTSFYVTPAYHTQDTLLRLLIDKAHEWDAHEDQELLRVRQPDGDWFAPFHPHHWDGNRKFAAAAYRGPTPATPESDIRSQVATLLASLGSYR